MRCVRRPAVGCSRRAKIQSADFGVVKEVGSAILDANGAEFEHGRVIGHPERRASILLDE